MLVSSLLSVIYLYKYCSHPCLSLSPSKRMAQKEEPGEAVNGNNRNDHTAFLLRVNNIEDPCNLSMFTYSSQPRVHFGHPRPLQVCKNLQLHQDRHSSHLEKTFCGNWKFQKRESRESNNRTKRNLKVSCSILLSSWHSKYIQKMSTEIQLCMP